MKHLWIQPDLRRVRATYLLQTDDPVTAETRREAALEAMLHGWHKYAEEVRVAIVEGGDPEGPRPDRTAPEVGECWLNFGHIIAYHDEGVGGVVEEDVR